MKSVLEVFKEVKRRKVIQKGSSLTFLLRLRLPRLPQFHRGSVKFKKTVEAGMLYSCGSHTGPL